MVRLEEKKELFFSVPLQISIPYGSIRGLHNFASVIPRLQFQFLMVRLEVTLQKDGGLYYAISIPYGSIRGADERNLRQPHRHFNSLWFD